MTAFVVVEEEEGEEEEDEEEEKEEEEGRTKGEWRFMAAQREWKSPVVNEEGVLIGRKWRE